MSKFTPGPWEWHADKHDDGRNNGSVIWFKHPGQAWAICKAPQYATDGEWEANARLIAAAPRMYELLSDTIMTLDSPKHEGLHGEILETLEHIDGNC